jgi:hypothetical protein
MHALGIEIEQIVTDAEQLKPEKSAVLIPPAQHHPKPPATERGYGFRQRGLKGTSGLHKDDLIARLQAPDVAPARPAMVPVAEPGSVLAALEAQ